ncbi:S26 family signal peptidase [Actinomadura macrotermitis]|uniref:Peptidase S26 domain-containing protein n=1 Tax=Actinomadura macrotermitis TaxID=2585200 RepID=A0A7K0C4N1_9ACTN|nr:S26 family signal peptidase [Actinomadura macrotermitis]MQY08407.1 hypothetical protein [Actinomadura macrotermitis]
MSVLLWVSGTAAGTALAAGAALAAARRRLVVVTVGGPSMEPTYVSGDRVLVLRRRSVRRGDVVVLAGPHDPPAGGLATTRWFVKRVAALPGDPVPERVRPAVPDPLVPPGKVVVLGDGARSADSRQWGYFPLDGVLGVAVRRLSRREG